MTKVSPYKRSVYPTIEGNDRIYFDNEFAKIEKTLGQIVEVLSGSYEPKTISSGAVTLAASDKPIQMLELDTEGAAATDDLDTINMTGGGKNGQIVTVWAASSARTVVVKDGTGNLYLAGDFSLDNSSDSITLQWWEGAGFYELSRSDNGA